MPSFIYMKNKPADQCVIKIIFEKKLYAYAAKQYLCLPCNVLSQSNHGIYIIIFLHSLNNTD